jgi:hypothetical protein
VYFTPHILNMQHSVNHVLWKRNISNFFFSTEQIFSLQSTVNVSISETFQSTDFWELMWHFK